MRMTNLTKFRSVNQKSFKVCRNNGKGYEKKRKQRRTKEDKSGSYKVMRSLSIIDCLFRQTCKGS